MCRIAAWLVEIAKIRAVFFRHSIGRGFSALVVSGSIKKVALSTGMQIGATAEARIGTTNSRVDDRICFSARGADQLFTHGFRSN
jgi:hypothetical protein